MDLFLVRARISKRRYMQDKDEVFEDIRLVKAISEEAATDRYERYWEWKNSAYDVSYIARIESVTGVLE